jgi:hypothetical protein
MTVTISRPGSTEYAPFHSSYVGAVPDGDVLALLERQGRETVALLRSISEKKSQHRYQPGKWSIRQVVGHIIDAERVFTYRALTFARGDAIALPGFDENQWAEGSNADHRTLAELIDEFAAVRAASVALFRGFGESEFARSGKASGHNASVRALAYVTTGHERHHVKILKERYGV